MNTYQGPQTIEEYQSEVQRLRQRVHDLASEHQKTTAKLQSRLEVLRNRYIEAREFTRDWDVTWTTEPASQEPYGWWRYTSISDCNAAVVLIERMNVAEAAIKELSGVLHQAYVSADTRELQLTIRQALKKYDVDPED